MIWPLLLLALFADPLVKQVSYDFDRVWNTTHRLLRVDHKWQVKEADREIGYLVFDFVDDKKKRDATLELVRATDSEGRDAVRVRLKVEEVSLYVRERFLERLAQKLREDYGPPQPPKKKDEPKPPPAPDAGVPGYQPRP
jgi:hypothetical protein